MMNKDKEKEKRKKIVYITLSIIVLVAVFIVLGMYLVNAKNKDKANELAYTDLIKEINEGKVEEVEMTVGSNTVKTKIKDVEEKKITNVPNTQAFIELIQQQKIDKNNDIKLNQKQQSIIVKTLTSLYGLLPTIMILVLFFLVIKMQGLGDKSKVYDSETTNSKVKFEDVAGLEEEKQELIEIVDFLKNPKRFYEMGAKIPRGVLLCGKPGTGKTLIAKAIAGEADVPFISMSGSEFIEMFAGLGASRVRKLFEKAKKISPCIVFIDEIDAVVRQRGAGLGGGHDEREQTLNQLLVEMDGFGANEGIIMIAATNRPDILDPALLRPGRFDRQIMVGRPDRKGREAVLEVHTKKKPLDNDVSLDVLAKRTPGFSGADLENLLNEAALLAVRRNLPAITMAEIDEATDRVLMGPAKVSHTITPKEKELIALHESGHAVIGMKVPDAEVVHKITIIPRGVAGGYTMMLPKEEKIAIMTKSELLSTITGLLGGRVSEELFFGEITTGASDDFSKATKIARSMVTEYGMSDLGPVQLEQKSEGVFLGRDYNKSKNFSDAVALEIDQEVRKIMNQCYSEATRILKENEKLVRLLADTLIERETITKEEIEELVETGHISDNFTPSEDTVSLKERAKVLGVKGYTKMTDEELKKAIEKAEDSSK